jgi:hypothetical protein
MKNKKVILIDLASIKVNKNAGATVSNLLGHQTITVKGEGEPPKFLEDYGLRIMSVCSTTALSSSKAKWEGTLDRLDENLGKLIVENKATLELEVNRPVNTLHHAPIPKYSFNYENIVLRCEECNEDIDHRLIDTPEEGNGDVCPNCHAIDSFEEYEYEKVEEAISRRDGLPPTYGESAALAKYKELKLRGELPNISKMILVTDESNYLYRMYKESERLNKKILLGSWDHFTNHNGENFLDANVIKIATAENLLAYCISFAMEIYKNKECGTIDGALSAGLDKARKLKEKIIEDLDNEFKASLDNEFKASLDDTP